MRCCADHWAVMRKAVHDRGLSHLVAGSGHEAVARTMREIEAHEKGTPPPDTDFDPLMAMNWSFVSKVMDKLGLSVMAPRTEPDGMPDNIDEAGFNHICPLCVVRRQFDTHNTATGRCDNPGCDIQLAPGEPSWDLGWVEGCADAMFQQAVEKGLVKPHG